MIKQNIEDMEVTGKLYSWKIIEPVRFRNILFQQCFLDFVS